MASVRVSLTELRTDPIAAYRAGGGAPVAVEHDGVVLFFLTSAVDTIEVIQTTPVHPVPPAAVQPAVDPGALDRLPEMVNLTEAAELVDKSKSTLSRAVAADKLPISPRGNTYQIKVTDLAAVFGRPDLLDRIR